MEGLVLKSTGSWYSVRTDNGKIYQCRTRGKLRLKGIQVTNPVAVGDKVEVEPENEEQAIISDIIPRKNYLIRKSIKKSKAGHILAANIGQAVLIATVTFPRTSLGFIDRFLVAAESFRIPQLLVFNKCDLHNKKMEEYMEELKGIYMDLGVDFLVISAEKELNLDALTSKLTGKTSLIAGHSGVGKSTLLNKIAPNIINQGIGEVSTFANKGTHTTTFAEMFEISEDTFVIDTPGIKELGLIDLENGEISHFFPEMRSLFGECKFHNCTHIHEPGCAVIKCVEEGSIASSRYYSYLSIMEEEDTHH
jgi:ribosome biogenesis GTPase